MSDWLDPQAGDTEVLEPFTWKVGSLTGLLKEINGLKGIEERPLWRGHEHSTWQLDSTMARWVRQNLRNRTLSSLVEKTSFESAFGDYSRFALFKFKHVLKPSSQFLAICKKKKLDPHFEVIKNLQQFPEIYSDWIVQSGTPMQDWTENPNAALFFVVSNSTGAPLVNGQGAVFAFLKSRSGNTWIKGPVSDLFEEWERAVDEGRRPGTPLIVCPEKQMAEDRPRAQDAIYVLQADLSLPLDVYWLKRSEEIAKQIFLKLLIPSSVKLDVWEYLQAQYVTAESLFPPVKVV